MQSSSMLQYKLIPYVPVLKGKKCPFHDDAFSGNTKNVHSMLQYKLIICICSMGQKMSIP